MKSLLPGRELVFDMQFPELWGVVLLLSVTDAIHRSFFSSLWYLHKEENYCWGKTRLATNHIKRISGDALKHFPGLIPPLICDEMQSPCKSLQSMSYQSGASCSLFCSHCY